MPPISTAQERSPLACANVQGIATPIKASSSFQTLIKSSGKLSWSARSKKGLNFELNEILLRVGECNS